MFADSGSGFPVQAGRASAIQTGTKLYISNLDYGVSNEDIKVFIPFVDYWNDKRDFFFVWFCWQWRCLQELFSEVGEMKRYGIHYDKSGRSKVAYEA